MAESVKNPYWDTVHHLVRSRHVRAPHYGSWVDRNRYCREYAWAIPDPAALAFVAEWLTPQAVEMGAGRGYWAWLLQQMGVDILAYDIAPPSAGYNHYHTPTDAQDRPIYGENGTTPCYTTVLPGDAATLQQHPDRVLFLCWPPYDDPMGVDCLQAYPGRRVVYIGEDDGGCTGDDAFFAELAAHWHEVASHPIAQWDGIYDGIKVFERD